MRSRWLPSPISVLIGSIIVLLSIGGYFFLQHNVDQQESALLDSNTTDVGTTASSFFSNITSGVSSAASVVTLTDANPAQFEAFVGPSNAFISYALVNHGAGGYAVVGSTGTDFKTGELLTGGPLATVQSATGSKIVSGPVTSNGTLSHGLFAVKATNGYYVLEQITLPTHFNIASALGKAYNNLDIALYGPGPTTPNNLLVVTTKSLPLASPTAMTTFLIGTSKWTVVASARTPFVSGLASSGPLILLVMGLFIALMVTLTVETVQRRHRYAQGLVEERTADLNASLSELKEAQNALVRQERLSAVGEMASVVGHELRNPLAAVTNALFIVRGDLGEDVSATTEKYLSMAERETSKAAVLADDLTAFVRPREKVETEVEVPGLVEEVLSATPQPPDVQVDLDVAACKLKGDRGQLAEVLTNLVTNAYQAMPNGGTMSLGASCMNGTTTFTVEDTGSGIQGASMTKVFEPFFTTKTNGTGLGLAIVQRLVQAHGGEIELVNTDRGGVRATVVLPTDGERVST